jgi:hypothetical protein
MKNSSENQSGSSTRKVVVSIVIGIMAIILLLSLHSLAQNVKADEIVVIQSPLSGKLSFYFSPGLKFQGFGKVTIYHKERQYWFSARKDQGTSGDQSIKIRFNDGGHATLSGSVRWKMPLDVDGILKFILSMEVKKLFNRPL